MTFLFLGTGSSAGVPVIGCDCAVCTSADPCNQRLRPSGLLTLQGKRLLLDAGPDFRQQALQNSIDHLDGVLITHTHFDHVAGLDELRIYYLKHQQKVPVLCSKETLDNLHKRYDYLFREKTMGISLAAQLETHLLEGVRGETTFVGLPLSYTSYRQGGLGVTGFRFGSFAYISDIREYEEPIFDDLAGVETLVLSALHEKPTPMHLSLDEATAFAERVGAKKTWLTHLSHRLDHQTTNAKLPKQVQLAHDGLEITL